MAYNKAGEEKKWRIWREALWDAILYSQSEILGYIASSNG